MEGAREAFAGLEGLTEVAIASDTLSLQALSVRASSDHDWKKTLHAALARTWWFQVVRADDDAANFERLRVTEAAAVQGLDPMAVGARQAAWITIGEAETALLAERVVLHAVEQLIAMRARVWDPRLEVLVPGAEGLRRFWTVAAPQLPAAAAIPGDRALGERIQAARQAAAAAEPPAGVPAARFVLDSGPDRWLMLQVFWQRVHAVCGEVQRHAEGVAASTRDPARRQAYRELAQRCGELVAAAAAAVR